MLPIPKSVSRSPMTKTSNSPTLTCLSTSRTSNPLSVCPTLSQLLTLTSRTMLHHTDLSQWSVSFTLKSSNHKLVSCTVWLKLSASCHSWRLQLAFLLNKLLVWKWPCCVNSRTCHSFSTKALLNCHSSLWKVCCTLQGTTCLWLTQTTNLLTTTHPSHWFWVSIRWRFLTTLTLWQFCTYWHLFWSYLSFHWRQNVSEKFK